MVLHYFFVFSVLNTLSILRLNFKLNIYNYFTKLFNFYLNDKPIGLLNDDGNNIYPFRDTN